MESYHVAWLSAHPTRTEGWLKDKLADGFDVHHLDGDHNNDDPSNLVLIEHADHMRLHGMSGNSGRLKRLRAPRGVTQRTMLVGAEAYAHRLKGRTWKDIARRLGCRDRVALSSAKAYARESNLAWPCDTALIG